MSKKSFKNLLNQKRIRTIGLIPREEKEHTLRTFTVSVTENVPQNEFLELKKLEIQPGFNSHGFVTVKARTHDIAGEVGFDYFKNFHSITKSDADMFKVVVYSA